MTAKYFTKSELACKKVSKKGNCGCGGSYVYNEDAVHRLDNLREIIGVPFSPNSAYRCPVHNANVGGAKNSMHVHGRAFDIPIKGKMTREVIHKVARLVGFTGIGHYANFVHVDTGTPREWDSR